MALIPTKFAAAAAGLAVLSMSATPVAAAELPVSGMLGVSAYDAAAENVQQYRYRRHRDRGIDAGDVVAGMLVIGAIAAIASSSSNKRDDNRRVVRQDARYRENDRRYDSRGMERAVDMCVDQVETGRERVEDIDRAERNASGWYVSGRVDTGNSFSCRIDNDGRIRSIDIGDGYSANDAAPGYYGASTGSGQLSDEAYARARAATRTPASGAYQYDDDDRYNDGRYDAGRYADEPQPAYPGGPLPGEEGYDEAVRDGRYDIATR